jgi:tetratricopeptide (TPR) repeat protein
VKTTRARSTLALACIAALTAMVAQPAGAQNDLAAARAAYLAGRYDDAIARFSRLAERQPEAAVSVRGLVQTLTEVGRYDRATRVARRFVEQNPTSSELWNALGETLVLQGRREDAEAAFAKAVAGGASDSLTARLNLAVLRYRQGDVARALRQFDSFIDVYNRSTELTSTQLTAVATAVRYLGVADWQLYEDALRAYDEASAADRDNFDAQLLVGDLFLEKYEGTEARQTFDAILARNPQHPRALLGLARTRRFAGGSEAMALVERSLEVNPSLVPARVFRASLLIEVDAYDEAAQEIDRALAVDPTSLEALAVLGAIEFLRGDAEGFWETRRRALALNPRFAEFYNTLAELSARNRLYHEAVRLASQAVGMDSTSWRGFGLLGINQLRIGSMRDGRANLETAFRGNPYDAWTKNTLDLLDTLEQYEERATRRFRLVIDAKEADLLSLYAGELAEDAYERLAARYDYSPPAPVRIEIYPHHADFSVRTVGLVGLGALGVSFGPVVAMDSPSARPAGSFHWGSTLWHEIAHTFHLGMSNHKVPRWFTEGLAVFEERRARTGWGDNVTPGFLVAYRDGRLLPVSELNNGFMRPAYPEQLGFSYYEASLVCELIERDHGPDALRRMLLAYRDGQSTDQVFRSVIATRLDDFDDHFDRYLRERFGDAIAALRSAASVDEHGTASRPNIARGASGNPDDYVAQLSMGRSLLDQGRASEAVPFLERAKELFPEYAGPAAPYWLLAAAYRTLGNTQRAVSELRTLTEINAGHYEAHLALAELLEAAGDHRGAAGVLDRAQYVYPLDMGVHRRLAALVAETGDWGLAIRERRAVLALGPVDQADAWYQLARAYLGGGDRAGARRAVLRALEIAPGFADAQDLLLELHDVPKNE